MANTKAKLIFEDGSEFEGVSFGYEDSVAGEVVFNTGMVGYPETLSDPSYKGQILILTYPLIGNYGVPKDKPQNGISSVFESDHVQVTGLIISNYSKKYYHFTAEKSLSEWLKEHKIPGLYAIDTRALTKKIREKGVMLGKIEFEKQIEFHNPDKENQVDRVSIARPQEYGNGQKKIVLVDCGMKNNILRSFLKRDLTIKRVPWNYDFVNEDCDGLFISNGPGDPKHCQVLIDNVKKFMKRDLPIFGICLGNQILALAAGANTYKLKYGHRSQNQPCIDEGGKRCYITSQNHGYCISEKSLPRSYKVWFRNGNDKTIEGIKHKTKPFFSVQFHPEATPGPVDTAWLFDEFVKSL
ncbi:glutamine-hydrolyzing carbamoyl-phosphate synthase small subunit [Patescibacteria group bacterium]|nr:glutamine-hydrolyzing carbamoyl-phosphate synthase small subunit [Patescibacteria group bacterium]